MLDLNRRHLVVACSLWPLGASTAERADLLLERMRQGRCALLLRHALTDPGVGDPPDFRLDTCSTQRNLSAEGRAQAEAIGAWFAARQLRPSAVLSSAWCRCIDTATLAFGRADVWPALNSQFGERPGQAEAERDIARRLASIARGHVEVWVTHQVNISALTGQSVAMGEGWLIAADTAAAKGLRAVGQLTFRG